MQNTITFEKVLRPALAAVFILIYWTTHTPDPVGTTHEQEGGVINYYETKCQKDARETYGVPLNNEASAQWQREHLNTSEGRAYNEAAAACPSPAKWDFDNMILVGTE
jgi:hypothetical protein